MFRERFEKQMVPKAELPSEEELDISHKAFQEADPTQFTPLPISAPLTDLGQVDPLKRNRLYAADDELLVGLFPENNPETQKVLSMLVKGIVPVADIVRHIPTATMHSKVMPHDRVQTESSGDEVLANRELLAQVFGDRDHNNRNIRDELGQVTFYDTEPVLDFALKGYNQDHTKASLELLLHKVEELESRLTGEAGKKFFDSVARVSAATPVDFYIHGSPGVALFTMDDVYNTLMRNIQATKTQVRARLSEFEEAGQ